MKKIYFAILSCLLASLSANAQEDVTEKYIKNPDFEINYLTYWTTSGMQMQNNASFGKHGGVYVEKWVASGSVGTGYIRQELKSLPQGKYTLTVKAKLTGGTQKGAVIFAGDSTTTVTDEADYSVDFTHLHGNITIGLKFTSATGNWVCCDNFRLVRHGDAYEGAAEEDARLYQAERDSLANLYANASGATPTVVGSDYIAIGSTFALGRSTITNNGASIKERGYCYSTSNPEPTVMDNTSTYTYSHEGIIYVIEPLAPQTFYWVRPYVITNDNVVAYGEPKYIATLPKGGSTWTYGYEGNDEQNARIVQAVNNGIVNYNDCMGLKNFNLNSHYVYGAGAGDGTADCNYEGWMRISQKEAYQRTGTVQHEFAHGVGVGTAPSWSDTNIHKWEWFGRRANDLVKFFENSNNVQVVGDGTHTWAQNTNGRTNALINYGINGAGEDNNTQLLYRANAMLVEAEHEDGLNARPSYHNGTPCYSFAYYPNKKYYLMNKSDECGLGEGLLYQLRVTSIAWKSYKNCEVSDSAAWYIEYIPASGYYTFKNVMSGRYLTNKDNNIALRTATRPTSTEYFQLMPDRTDVTINHDGKKITTHGYWFTWYNTENKAMQASALDEKTGYGTISQKTFNSSNSATNQQWIIISEDELENYNMRPAVPTDIGTITIDDKEVEGVKTVVGIYTIGGAKLSSTQPGINIIRYSDGTSKKVFVQ
ncbi:MAG: hypothetical protein J1F40_09440 [Prevotellaceae bacterium]|nr:hypothetical protein [Prevotellaceae bacterium]